MTSATEAKQKLNELIEKRKELDKEIQILQISLRADVLGRIRTLMQTHGITNEDLGTTRRAGPTPEKGSKAGFPVKAKYQDDKGNTWTGRGLKPRWLTEALAADPQKKLEDFLIKE